ncbi:MAG: hypothetical protein AB7I40_21195 [Nocardioides sp.]
MASLTLAVGGAGVAIVNGTQRDDAGYLMSDSVTLGSGGYAITSPDVEIDGAGALPHRILGDAKVTAETNGDAALFVGVARTADVKNYLGDVQTTRVSVFADDPVYEEQSGGAPATAPGKSDIWVAQQSGTGPQSITWPVENGNWTVVVMNADSSRGVSADVTTGATVPVIGWIYGGLFVAAGLTLVIGVVLLVVAIRRKPNVS